MNTSGLTSVQTESESIKSHGEDRRPAEACGEKRGEGFFFDV